MVMTYLNARTILLVFTFLIFATASSNASMCDKFINITIYGMGVHRTIPIVLANICY